MAVNKSNVICCAVLIGAAFISGALVPLRNEPVRREQSNVGGTRGSPADPLGLDPKLPFNRLAIILGGLQSQGKDPRPGQPPFQIGGLLPPVFPLSTRPVLTVATQSPSGAHLPFCQQECKASECCLKRSNETVPMCRPMALSGQPCVSGFCTKTKPNLTQVIEADMCPCQLMCCLESRNPQTNEVTRACSFL